MRYRIQADTVITVDDAFHIFQPGQVTWDGHVIVSVGPPELDTSRVDQEINVSGGIVMPGFYNGHNHAAMTLLRGLADDSPFFEWLEQHIWPREARLTSDDIYVGTLLAAIEMIKSGTVAFADMYFEMEAVARATEESGMRGWLSRGLVGNDDLDFVKLNQSVEFVDAWRGKAEGRIVPMLGPHAPYTCSPAYLARVGQVAKDLGVGIHIHLAESPTEVQQMQQQYGLSPIGVAWQAGLFESRLLIAHGVHIQPEDLGYLTGMTGGIISCPISNAKLGNGIMPYSLLSAQSVPVGLGTDGAASTNSLDMFLEMKAMAWMQKLVEGRPEAFNARTALTMATRRTAEILGSAGGVLEPGRPADLIVVDATAAAMTPEIDPVANVVYTATGSNVLYTVVNGEILLADGLLTRLDERAIIQEAKQRLQHLFA
ncbi:MAG: amidohydrolase [Sulfobacillus thermotolerans]|nr:amidohydrolase [Sulfobacillus thermotolerans]